MDPPQAVIGWRHRAPGVREHEPARRPHRGIGDGQLGIGTAIDLILHGRDEVVRAALRTCQAHVRIAPRRHRLSGHGRFLAGDAAPNLERHDAAQVVFDVQPVGDQEAIVERGENNLAAIPLP